MSSAYYPTMAAEAKEFDCVEMKRKAQERLLAEYEARRAEFKSYAEFLRATLKESPWASEMWERLRGERAGMGRR